MCLQWILKKHARRASDTESESDSEQNIQFSFYFSVHKQKHVLVSIFFSGRIADKWWIPKFSYFFFMLGDGKTCVFFPNLVWITFCNIVLCYWEASKCSNECVRNRETCLVCDLFIWTPILAFIVSDCPSHGKIIYSSKCKSFRHAECILHTAALSSTADGLTNMCVLTLMNSAQKCNRIDCEKNQFGVVKRDGTEHVIESNKTE